MNRTCIYHVHVCDRLQQEHERAVEEVKKELLAELEREREAVRREGREGVERVRREMEEERAEEERKLRDRKLKNMTELQNMVNKQQAIKLQEFASQHYMKGREP